MRKHFFLAVCALFGALVLNSCKQDNGPDGGKLSTPVLSVKDLTSESFTVEWEAVENAVSYVYTINGEEEKSTSQPTASFDNLIQGTYQVRVKAVPLAGSEYTESDWASVDVDIVLDDSWFTINVYLDNDEVFDYYDYNSIYFDIHGRDVASVKIGIFLASTAEGMSNEEIIAGLSRDMNQSGIDELNASGSLTGNALNNLEADTEYVLAAYAEHLTGVTKLVVCDPIRTNPLPERPEALDGWLGTYEVVSTHSLEMYNAGGYAGFNYTEEPMTFTIRIQNNPVNVYALFIYGWGVLSEQMGTSLPILAEIADDQLSLNMVSGYVTYNGTSLVWVPICERGDGTYSFLSQGSDYLVQFRNEDDGTITGTPYSGSLQGVDYTVKAVDLFGLTGSSVSIYHAVPVKIPAGNFTLTRVQDTETAKNSPIKFFN